MAPSIPSTYDEELVPRSAASEGSDYGTMQGSMMMADIFFTPTHLKFLNMQLSNLEPQDILRWCLMSLPGLYQTTALGLTGTSLP
jgi:phosphoadenosine phosphosulfate reductase